MTDLTSKPQAERYFEDYIVGSTFEWGPIEVEEAEVIAFATRFDPQTMHVDAAGAALGPFKGIIASGWHTVSLLMRLYVDHYLPTIAGIASPGVDEIRWPRPVRPGDELRLRVAITEARVSKTKPDRGLVISKAQGVNQRDEVVATFTAMNLFLLRAPAKP